jgi:hypothetical protein
MIHAGAKTISDKSACNEACVNTSQATQQTPVTIVAAKVDAAEDAGVEAVVLERPDARVISGPYCENAVTLASCREKRNEQRYTAELVFFGAFVFWRHDAHVADFDFRSVSNCHKGASTNGGSRERQLRCAPDTSLRVVSYSYSAIFHRVGRLWCAHWGQIQVALGSGYYIRRSVDLNLRDLRDNLFGFVAIFARYALMAKGGCLPMTILGLMRGLSINGK